MPIHKHQTTDLAMQLSLQSVRQCMVSGNIELSLDRVSPRVSR